MRRTGELSAYEKRQTRLALKRQMAPKPTSGQAQRQKQEDDMIRRALAHLSPKSLELELERMR